MRKHKKSKRGKFLSRSITILCLGVFLYAAYGLVDIALDYYQNRKMLNDTQEVFYDAISDEEGTDESGVRSGFDALLKDNPDVVGWITIDGTQIDYPVLQAPDNETYLTHNFNHDESRAGSIYLDYRNDIESSDRNTVIYGHRMKDGSMFQHLTKFLDKDFLEEHKTFQYDTLYGSYEAEIFAVYNTLTTFDYIKTDFSGDEEFEQLLSDIEEESIHHTDVEVGKDDQIITLSTCDYKLDKNEGRLAIQAKLTKK